MANILQAKQRIASLRKRYYKALPGKEALMQLINESEVSEHVYNSNAIENSTLSLEETEKILLQLDLERYVTEREIFEAKNLARVMAYVGDKAKKEELTLDSILLLHKMLIRSIDDGIAGRFRTTGEYVRVGNYIAPAPEQVVTLLEHALTALYADTTSAITKKIARFHLTFEHIHPFCDGNGRIGRVLNNYVLLREGYVPINIAYTDRTHYYNAFRAFDTKQETRLMEDIVAKALSASYHKRLAYLEEKEIVTLNTYAKTHKLSHAGLINKAKRQTIEAFIEKGIWKIVV